MELTILLNSKCSLHSHLSVISYTTVKFKGTYFVSNKLYGIALTITNSFTFRIEFIDDKIMKTTDILESNFDCISFMNTNTIISAESYCKKSEVRIQKDGKHKLFPGH